MKSRTEYYKTDGIFNPIVSNTSCIPVPVLNTCVRTTNFLQITPVVEKGEGEWAVYRVFQKRRKQPKSKSKARGIVSVPNMVTPTPTVIDFRNEAESLTGNGSESDPLPPPPPPSPCLSSSAHDQGE